MKVYEVVLEKDSEASKSKKEKYKSLALKSKKVSSDEEASCSDSNDEEYAMVIRDFKKFFRRRGKFVRQPYDEKRPSGKKRTKRKEKKIVGCWSDSDEDDDPKKDEICLLAHDSNEILFDTPYYSSSLDDESLQNEYNKEMIKNQILQKDKKGLGFTEDKASTSKTNTGKMGQESTKMPYVEPTHTVPSAKVPASEKERYRGTVSAYDTSKPILQNRIEFVQITKKTSPSDTIGNVKQIPALKLG
ncbi:hypothetical protein Tco_1033758 [Tanacetum coccineum]